MMMVNGSPMADVEVWKTTVPVVPNTNYAFSTWICSISVPNPAQLSFSINGKSIGNLITASLPPCNWVQYYTVWNSGNSTSATISIVNKNTILFGNDFALDDISFAPLYIKKDSVKITIKSEANFTINSPLAICENKSVQLNASGGDVYNWTPSVSLNNPSLPNPTASPVTSTLYSVTITDTVCNISASLSTAVTVNPLPLIKASKSGDVDCSISQVQLLASGATQYSWSPAATLNNSNSSNPLASPTVSTLYTVTGTDNAGCSNTDTITVDVKAINPGLFQMPSAFTPNNDGLNDCYGLKYWGIITRLEFSIFNRWGEQVFYTTNPAKCWDGQFKGVPQNPGVFVYMIKATSLCGEVFRKGTFVLIR
jgi:gliding motility-associated-like protein